MTQDRVEQWRRAARQLGVEHAQAAAEWMTDLAVTPEYAAETLRMLRAGDDVAERLPWQPDLSGEWADALTPNALFERIVGLRPGAALGEIVENALRRV